MATRTERRTLEHRNKFIIEIDADPVAAFTTCTDLKKTAEVIELKEGASQEPIKELGDTTYEAITLTRGVGLSSFLWDWSVDCMGSPSTLPLPIDQIKKGFDIVQLGRAGEELRRWTVYGGMMSEFTAGSWDKGANEPVIETAVIQHDGYDLVQ